MFLLNEALRSIEAAEPQIVSVHRCTEALFLAPERREQQMCEAFACLIREGGNDRVHPAIYLTRSRQALVYERDPQQGAGATAETLQRALQFLEGFGFRMEPVNLGGNQALRRVVLGGIKVVQAPQPGTARPAAPEQVAPPAAAPPVAARAGAGTPQPPEKSATPPAAAQSAPERDGEQARKSAARIAQLERELAQARAELAELKAAGAGQLRADDDIDELALLQEDYQALRAEYVLINDELTERQSELQRLQAHFEEHSKTSAGEIAKLTATVLRLSAPAPTQERVMVQAPAAGSGPTAPSSPLTAAPAGAADEPVAFHLDPDLAAIPCRSSDEIVDLRSSFNAIRMTCGSAKAQNCNAYICGVQRAGRREIYLAIHLTEDRRSLIYVPQRQPADAEGYERALEGALSFVEVSGFIVNLEPLGGGPAARTKVFEKIPVLGLR
ncbi:hypothetical protein GMST_29240 [Geomonas silvestris]|uniref:Uncharacterized protein n=1 Tax=Geomonas silvestris TaxID=2740184 RepID=A0A6V8MLU1_9BACT|nr:hypothetical protein [Geomonas silvestris]GFO60599.1 hypothetical protein GMST_29240 [Geomonas silvestris]